MPALCLFFVGMTNQKRCETGRKGPIVYHQTMMTQTMLGNVRGEGMKVRFVLLSLSIEGNVFFLLSHHITSARCDCDFHAL